MPAATPNFFLIGAPKSGTTSLARYLAQHPAVYVSPIKEPCFFAPEVVDFDPRARAHFERDAPALREYLDGPMRDARERGIVLDWEDYLKLFTHAGAATAIGEASVSYLASPGAAAAIHARVPKARLLAVLRDPAERLFSHYRAARASRATDRPFVKWLDEQLRAEAAREPRMGPAWAGCYATHLQRYLEIFPRQQLRTYLYEDYTASPAAMLADIFEFLVVDSTVTVDCSQWHNVTATPRRRWTRAPMPLVATAAERAHAIELYADDIRSLESLIGRDLAAWLR
jgi:hypothetical protein